MTTSRTDQPNPNIATTTEARVLAASAQAVYDFSRAVLVGAAQGVGSAIVGMVDTLIHPIDNLLYPVSSFLYDATLISAGHVTTVLVHNDYIADHINSAVTAVKNEPQLYHDAVTRMEGRINQLRNSGQHFINAPWPEQVRMATMAITSLATNIYAPGAMINSVKAMINLQRYGVPYNPPTFHYWMERPDSFRSIPTYTLEEVRALRGEHPCLYAITQNNRLIIAPQFVLETNMIRVGSAEVPRVTRREIKHSELTKCAPVYIAGEMKTTDGLITLLDPNSGRYLAHGPHLKNFTEKFFAERGYTEAIGKFTLSGNNPSPFAIRVPNPMNPLPAAGVGAGVLNIIAEGIRAHHEQQQQEQRKAAQERLEQEQRRQHESNLYAEMAARQQVIARTQCFNIPYQPQQFPNITPLNLVWRAEQDAIWMFRLRYGSVPTWAELAIRQSISSGMASFSLSNNYHSLLGHAEFSLALMANNLINSYNAYNLNSYIYSASGYGRIGGVAVPTGTFTDLINSDAHASADSYYLCFPAHLFQEPTMEKMFYQIISELDHAHYEHHTSPFFSLDFNQSGILYPIIHPAFQNTLVGRVIGFLDYWMKCFLNGGTFDEKFLDDWHVTENTNDAHLRSFMIDLKKYCKQSFSSVAYASLRELESQYGIKDIKTNSVYKQPYMTAFRIIAFIDRIEREGNVLIPYPDFRVEYSVDIMPDYQQYIDSYMRDHGTLPPEHQKTLSCYEEYAQKIKEEMCKLKFCKDYFNLLSMITTISYLNSTLNKMGKRTEIDPHVEKKSYIFPKSFPPIPVRYFKSYDLTITLKDVLTLLIDTTDKTNSFNQALSQLFVPDGKLPEIIKNQITAIITTHIKNILSTHLSPQEIAELNEEDINKMVNTSIRRIENAARSFSGSITGTLLELIQKYNLISDDHISEFIALSLQTQITKVQALINIQIDQLVLRWGEVPDTSKKEVLNNLWESSENMIQDAMNLYSKIIPIKQAKKASELAKLSPEQKAANQANIAEFEKNMDEEKNALSRLKEFDNIFSYLGRLLANVTSNIALTPEKIKTVKADIVKALQKLKESHAFEFAHYQELILNLSKRMMESDEFINQVIAKKYTHSFQSFTGQVSADKTGDNFHIIGGCGVSMPDLQCQVLPHANIFCESLAKSFSSAKQKKGQFEHNGETYIVYRVAVFDLEKPNRNTTQEAMQKEITLQILNNVIKEHISIDSLKLDQVKTKIDQHGSSVMHYAAAHLKPEHFAKVAITGQGMFKDKDQYGHFPIHRAAQTGNVEAISIMLAKFPELLDVKNNRGLTPLMIAIQYGHLNIIQFLHSKGADFNICLSNGLFPLYMAIQKNFTPIALWMLDNVANLDVNKSINSNMTSLHLSIENKETLLSQRLIEKGASCTIKRKADGYTPLHNAAKQGDVVLLKKMLATGIDVNLKLESKKTPLHLAAEAGKLPAVQLLVERGALVDAQTVEDETPLMLAIIAGEEDTALWLASTKSGINIVNQQKQSASLLAVQYAMPQVGLALVNRGENPALQDVKQTSFLYYVIRNGEYHTIKLLIKRGISFSALIHGNSALALAAQFGHFLIVYALQEINIPYQSTTSFSLLQYAVMADEIGYLIDAWRNNSHTVENDKSLAVLAAKNGSWHCFDYIMNQLPEIAQQNDEILIAAIERNDEKIITRALKHCKDINRTLDKEGHTALHLAVKYGSHHVLPKLAELGCQFSKMNSKKQTAFHLAIIKEDADMLKRLFKLSDSSEWPHDLWQNKNHKINLKIEKILKKYKSRLPNHSISAQQNLPQINEKDNKLKLLPRPILKTQERHLLEMFKNYIKFQEFDKAAFLLEKHSFLVALFKSEEGGALWQLIFSQIEKNNTISEESIKSSAQQIKHDADRLLMTLKKKDINPELYQGKNNILLFFIRSESDESACFRLNVFMQYFPNHLSNLVEDKSNGEYSIAQLALIKNYLQFFEKIDEAYQKKNGSNDTHFYALHEAILAGKYDSVVRLLNGKRHSVNSINEKGQTPLMLAALIGHLPLINLLLKLGASTDLHDYENKSLMHYALNKPSVEAALTLLPLIKKPNEADRRGVTPLMLAAAKDVTPIMRVLFELGQDVKSVDIYGHNALHHAAIEGKVESIKFLIEHSFDIDQVESPIELNKKNRSLEKTALHLAAQQGKVDAVLYLLEHNANPEKQDKNGFAFCEYAILSKNHEMIKFAKLTPYYHDKKRYKTMMQAAVSVDNVNVLSELILANADQNEILMKGGLSALHLTCLKNAPQCARLLLENKNLILDGMDWDGYAPLHYAAKMGNVHLIELLSAAGVNHNQMTLKGETALEIAYQNNRYGAVVSLLQFGADMTITNTQGLTIAQRALLSGQYDYVRIFQEAKDSSLESKYFPSAEKEKLEKALTIFKSIPTKSSLLMNHRFYKPQKPESTSSSISNIVSYNQ